MRKMQVLLWINLLNSYCWFPITNCVNRLDCSNGIWLYALFISAVVKYIPFIFVKVTWIGSLGQLHLDSLKSELRYLASRTVFSDSPLARIKTGLIKAFPFGCSSLFTGDMIWHCSRMVLCLLFVFWKLRQVSRVNVVVNLFFQRQI